jgi:polysaccharide export outer membrane protein
MHAPPTLYRARFRSYSQTNPLEAEAMSFFRKILTGWLLATAVVHGPAALAVKPKPAAADAPVIKQMDLPPPTGVNTADEERPYRIGAFDRLVIDVFGVEELAQKEIQADASGRISFPLIGVVEAAGRTPGELADEIEARLGERFVKDPYVTVNLKETVSQVVTVDGEVERPGLYPVIGKMTLVRAVATAEGETEFSNLSRVIIFRTVDGQQMAGIYDLKAIRRGLYRDPEVFANDVVVVGESSTRRLLKDVTGIFPAVATPLVLFLTAR